MAEAIQILPDESERHSNPDGTAPSISVGRAVIGAFRTPVRHALQ